MMESGDFESMIPKKQDLTKKIEDLLNSSKVLLFMKGSPDVRKSILLYALGLNIVHQ